MFTIIFEASTAHITPETNKWLLENAEKHDLSFIYNRLPQGFLFYISDHEEIITDRSSQTELIELIEGVLKLAPDCSFLLLDADGPIHGNTFKTFDWEEN